MNVFETNDNNPLTKGQVDLFFHNDFGFIDESNDKQIPIALMDGQGDLQKATLHNVLQLTNCIITHISYRCLNDLSRRELVIQRLEYIHSQDKNINIMAIIRDAPTNQVIRNTF